MRIDQVFLTSRVGDTNTHEALALRSALREFCDSDAFGDNDGASDMRPIKELSEPHASSTADVLVVYGEIDATFIESVAARPERLVLVHREMPRAHSLEEYSAYIAGEVRAAETALRTHAARFELALATSEASARYLRGLGMVQVKVVLPGLEALRPSTETHQPTENHIATFDGEPVLLCAGSMLPDGNHQQLLAAYEILVTHLVPEAHLIIAGATPLPNYVGYLQHYTRELNLERAWLAGAVTEAEMTTFYAHAQAFVSLSQANDFDTSVWRAMVVGVPVVATAQPGLNETVGGSALELPVDAPASLVAEALAELLSNAVLRAQLVDSGRKRAAALGSVSRTDRVVALLHELTS